MQEKIINELAKDLKTLKDFKRIYKNIVLNWNDIPEFPAISIVYSEDERSNENNKLRYKANIEIVIYNKQKSTNYEDNLTYLVKQVDSFINRNAFLKCNTVESYISDFKRDGGIIMPFSIAQMTLFVDYFQH
jgi:hypothetical protein